MWKTNTIQVVEELVGNPSDPRKTRSQFESALSIKDLWFDEKCYLVIEFDTQTYEETSEYPRWKTTME